MLADGPLQLPKGEDRLHQPRGADRMPTGQQPAGRIHRQASLFRQTHAVIHARQKRDAAFDESSALPVLAKPQVLVGLDLRGGVGVVQLDEAQILQRMADPCHLVGLLGCHSAAPEGMHTGILEVYIVRFPFVRQEQNFPVRAVGHAHDVRPGADTHDFDRAIAGLRCNLLGRQDTHRRTVRHGADVLHRQRRGHHGRFPNLFDREPLGLLGVRVIQSITVVLHGNHGHLFDRGSELVHVALDHHRVVAGIEAADREVEVCVRGQRDELIAFPRVDPRHGFEAEGQAAVHPA